MKIPRPHSISGRSRYKFDDYRTAAAVTGFWERLCGKSAMRRLIKAMRSADDIVDNKALVFSRHLRDSATASKSFLIVGFMDEFQWAEYTNGKVALQQIDSVKASFPMAESRLLDDTDYSGSRSQFLKSDTPAAWTHGQAFNFAARET